MVYFMKYSIITNEMFRASPKLAVNLLVNLCTTGLQAAYTDHDCHIYQVHTQLINHMCINHRNAYMHMSTVPFERHTAKIRNSPVITSTQSARKWAECPIIAHHKLTQPVLHVVWHIGGQGDMGQIWPALHGAPSPHGRGSPISSIAGPQLKSGVLWLYASTQNGPAHHGNVFFSSLRQSTTNQQSTADRYRYPHPVRE